MLNLDKFLPQDREFSLGGKVFKVPGAVSVAQALVLQKASEKVQAEPTTENTLEILERTWDILGPANPTLVKADLFDKLTVNMIPSFFAVITGTEVPEIVKEDETGLKVEAETGQDPQKVGEAKPM